MRCRYLCLTKPEWWDGEEDIEDSVPECTYKLKPDCRFQKKVLKRSNTDNFDFHVSKMFCTYTYAIGPNCISLEHASKIGIHQLEISKNSVLIVHSFKNTMEACNVRNSKYDFYDDGFDDGTLIISEYNEEDDGLDYRDVKNLNETEINKIFLKFFNPNIRNFYKSIYTNDTDLNIRLRKELPVKIKKSFMNIVYAIKNIPIKVTVFQLENALIENRFCESDESIKLLYSGNNYKIKIKHFNHSRFSMITSIVGFTFKGSWNGDIIIIYDQECSPVKITK